MGSSRQLVTLYARADREAFAHFDRHLSALKLSRDIEHFHSGEIAAGEQLAAMDDALDDADVVVCLLSADFLADRELMAQAERSAKKAGQTLIPVHLRPVEVNGTLFAGRQPLPPQGTVMQGDRISEEVLLQVVQSLSSSFRERLHESPLNRTPVEQLLNDIELACRQQEDQKKSGARLRRSQWHLLFPLYIEVTYSRPFSEHKYIVMPLLQTPQEADLLVLDELLRLRYLSLDKLAYAVLVHVGDPVDPAVLRRARELRIQIKPLLDYQGLIDFTLYLRDQNHRLEEDTRYPQGLYVPQRMVYSRGIGGPEDTASKDALTGLYDWILERDVQRFMLVLGEFGVGKTFLLHQLAQRLGRQPGAPVPVLLEMRSLEKARSLDELVAQHLAKWGMEQIDLRGFRYMLEHGHIALLFDGFDELALRVSYDRAAEHLDTITQAAQGQAKVVLTSRTQHFRSDDQVKTALAKRLETVLGHRAVRLLPFDDDQIREFLHQRLQDPVQAEARFLLFDEVKDLLGLSHNPRMLSFIAQFPEERLRAAQAHGEVTAAKLYEELLTWWIEHEWTRAHPPGLEDGLTKAQRWTAVEHLALRLWQQTESWIHVDDLSAAVLAALGKLNDVGVAAQQVGAGTLLCRDPGGRFSFIHQSVMEWLVARVAARQAADGGTALLGIREISPLMADFFADLHGRDAARAWARGVGGDRAASDVAKLNALLVRRRLGDSLSRQDLAGQDLRGRSFTGQDLESADLRGADLRGVDLRRARLVGADLRQADLRGASLLGADLTGAQLEGTRLERAALVGARLKPADWRQAACLGAALPWPDRPEQIEVMTHGSPRMGYPRCDLAFSPDGSLLAVPSQDNTVRLWEVSSGKELRVLSGHNGSVTSVSFSPDGLTLASASWDGTVRLWEVSSGKPLRVLSGHKSSVRSVSFSPDGLTLASGSEDHAVRVWTVSSGKPLRVLSGHQGSVNTVSFSPDGLTLASGSLDDTVRLWEVSSGKELRSLSGHESSVRSVSFSPDGLTLASASRDNTVRLWKVSSGEPLRVFSSDNSRANSVSFSPDGQTLACGFEDSTVRLCEVSAGKSLRVFSGHHNSVHSVSFSPDGLTLASGSRDNTVRLWEVSSGKQLRLLSGQGQSVNSVSVSADGQTLAGGSRDSTVRLWELSSGKQLRILSGHKGSINSVSFSADGRTLASGSADGTVRLWAVPSGAELHVLSGHQGKIFSVSFSADGQTLASGSADHTVRLWEVASGKPLHLLSGHHGSVHGVSFSADGQTLASGSSDYTVRLWEVASGKPLRLFSGHKSPVYSVSFSPDGQTLASGSRGSTVLLWKVSASQPLRVLSGHKGDVNSVSFSPDGQTLASGSEDNTVRLWEVSSGKLLRVLSDHHSHVYSVSFSPDGQTLASGSGDNTVRLWHLASGRCLAILIPGAEGWAALTPQGHYKLGGAVSVEVWHAIGLCRFELGELDPYLPEPLHLPEGYSFLTDPQPLSGKSPSPMKRILTAVASHSRLLVRTAIVLLFALLFAFLLGVSLSYFFRR